MPDWGSVPGLEPLGGRLLVATPLLNDPHFVRTVVYLLEHDGGGTVGVLLNRRSHTPGGQGAAELARRGQRSVGRVQRRPGTAGRRAVPGSAGHRRTRRASGRGR